MQPAFEKMHQILSKVNADYSDLRFEVKTETKIIQTNDALEQVGVNQTEGYVLRILKNGAFTNTSFTSFEDADEAIKRLYENSTILSEEMDEADELFEAKAIKDQVIPELNENPLNIPLEEKISLVNHYMNIPLAHKEIIKCELNYIETIRDKYFISSHGSEINESLYTVQFRGLITSKNNDLVQTLRVGTGSSSGFHCMRGLDQYFKEQAKIAIDLLSATPVNAGTYDIIVDQRLAGVFIHEAFGHLSEADIIEKRPGMLKKMQIGNKIGNEILSVMDDATQPGLLSYYKYDDEGVEVKPVQLIKNGILTGRLHNRITAKRFNEEITGHNIAEDYRYAPIIRMGCTYIEPGTDSFDELLKKLKDGLYIIGAKGGATTGENYTFGAGYGYEVKDGTITHMVRDLNISGNLYETLHNVKAVGNDLELSKVGGCGKGQMNPRSCMGGPHILITDCVVGGV